MSPTGTDAFVLVEASQLATVHTLWSNNQRVIYVHGSTSRHPQSMGIDDFKKHTPTSLPDKSICKQ